MPAVLGVEGLPDRTHSACADLRDEAVMRQRLARLSGRDRSPHLCRPWESGKLPEAEAIYREDLKRNPENGWSLFGLLQCLRAAGRPEVVDVEKRFREAWKYADVTLSASAF